MACVNEIAVWYIVHFCLSICVCQARRSVRKVLSRVVEWEGRGSKLDQAVALNRNHSEVIPASHFCPGAAVPYTTKGY